MRRKKPIRPEPLPLPGSPRTVPKPINFPRAIQTAKAALAAQDEAGTISLEELAFSLGIDKSRLTPLVEYGYLKVIEGEMVALPSRAAFDWLKSMFAPLTLRPMVSTEMIANMTGMEEQNVRRMYAIYNIPVIQDECFGELLTIESLYLLWGHMSEFIDPTRFDRQAFISLFQQKGNGKVLRTKPLEFSEKLETEIVRICKLPGVRRDFAAAALWDAFDNANTIAECAARYAAISSKDGLSVRSFDRISLASRLEAAKRKLALPGEVSKSG